MSKLFPTFLDRLMERFTAILAGIVSSRLEWLRAEDLASATPSPSSVCFAGATSGTNPRGFTAMACEAATERPSVQRFRQSEAN